RQPFAGQPRIRRARRASDLDRLHEGGARGCAGGGVRTAGGHGQGVGLGRWPAARGRLGRHRRVPQGRGLQVDGFAGGIRLRRRAAGRGVRHLLGPLPGPRVTLTACAHGVQSGRRRTGRQVMPRARPHAGTRARERRTRLAHEAARLMAESGIRDYQQAKRKAAARLGFHDDASLPRNREIEDALREYQRLFLGRSQPQELRLRREAALEAMEFLARFDPRLVGPVLEGTADARTPVSMQLFSDDADAVARFLEEAGSPAEARSHRLRLDRTREGEFPMWAFTARDLAFELTVLPGVALRQAPLSNVDERPMRRASASQLRQLLEDDGPDVGSPALTGA